MPISRSEFIRQLSAAPLALSAGNSQINWLENIQKASLTLTGSDPLEQAKDEDFWYTVRQAYRQSTDFTNLENGYYLPCPQVVLDNFHERDREINRLTSFYMRRRMMAEKLEIRKKLASYSGVPLEELLIVRNTTEALDTVILGLNIQPGDEILMAITEYSNMMASWDMRAKRFGITLKRFTLPLMAGNEAIVNAYKQNITPKTKVILISHVLNMNGQILPVREVADLAHKNGIDVICDAAHSFAHVDYQIPDLGVDYFGTSLHKWMGAPLGAGILQIKKEKIANVWPLFGDSQKAPGDIEKFEGIGTAPWAIYLAIADALAFHEVIGTKRKEARLRYLKNYWVNQVKELPGVKFNTPLTPHQSCAITNFYVEGKDPKHTADYLFDVHKVFTVAYDRAGIKGVRVTPNIHNSLNDLDKLVNAIKSYLKA